jgi:hypothetical protein
MDGMKERKEASKEGKAGREGEREERRKDGKAGRKGKQEGKVDN